MSASSWGEIAEVLAYAARVLSMHRPTFSGLKTRLPLALAAERNSSHFATRCVLQAIASLRQSSLTWHSASAFWAQNSASVIVLPPPPPPHPASNPAIAATCATVRLVMTCPPVD